MRAPRQTPPPPGRDPAAGQGAEQKLRQSEERFRSVFDHAPMGMLLLDANVRVLRANRALCRMLQFAEDELIGKIVTDLIHPDDRPASDAMRGRIFAGEVDVFSVERRAVRKDGEALALEVRSTVERDADGGVALIITHVVDVTEQRAQEAKLRESEARLRAIFDTAPIGMALIAPPGDLLQVNQALGRMLGRAPEELQRLGVPDFIHPDDLAATRAQVDAALAGTGPDVFAGESRYLRPGGQVVWGAFLSSLVRDADGAPRYFISQVIDMTERKLAEDALRDSEARYRGLVESSQDLIIRADMANNLSFVNDAWCAKFGLRRDDVVGKSFMPRIAEDDWSVAREALAMLATPPHRTRVKVRQATVEGIRWIEWEGCGIVEGGRVTELQAIGRDVTQVHENAEALRASEARYRGVVESQQAVVLRMSLDGKITFVNDYGSRILGLTRADMIGVDVLEWVLPEDRAASRAALARELGPPYRAQTENRVVIGGEIRWFNWEGTLIFDERGTPVEMQSVGFDITERRAAADALQASLQELRQSEEKLRLLAQRQVAVREEERKRLGFDLHDGVCQELIGIGILVESARRRYGAVAPEPSADLSRVGTYLGEVVEHLRVLAGELRPMLLHDLGLAESLRSLALGLATPATAIQTTFSARVPRLAEAAEVAVYRIAQEALTNALRHARPRTVTLGLAAENGRLRLEVRDDGCGFDPSRRRTTALGLLSMEERALALGGRLAVSSSPDDGTTVVLDCPLVERSRASAA